MVGLDFITFLSVRYSLSQTTMRVTRLLIGVTALTTLTLAPARDTSACSCEPSGPRCQNNRGTQEPTLAQRVEQADGNVEVVVIADGPPVALSRMLASTDIVVRGVIGEGVAQFTPDGQSITTTYTITNPTVLFSAMPPR
jgi:hypothetical protein